MLTLIIRRRRAEDARVARFLHAIQLSGRYTVDESWELQHVPDVPDGPDGPDPWPAGWRTDTVAVPTILLAGTPLL
jgi:hypothetical protein